MMLENWGVYGHDWAVEHLHKSLLNARVRHAYLFVGAESVGKQTLARALAMALNCTHPDRAARPCGVCRPCQLIAADSHADVFYAERDPNTGVLKIEEIRALNQKLALKPYEGRYRVAIYPGFDRAQPRAQDALLKTLEEPPPHAVLILLAESREALLSTITSRSQILHLRPASADYLYDLLTTQTDIERDLARLLAHLSGGRIGWALDILRTPSLLDARDDALDQLEAVIGSGRIGRFALAEQLTKDRDKERLANVLELWQMYWRDLVLLTQGSALPPANLDRADRLGHLAGEMTPDDAVTALHATRDLLQALRLNLNLRLALEVMLLSYPGLTHE